MFNATFVIVRLCQHLFKGNSRVCHDNSHVFVVHISFFQDGAKPDGSKSFVKLDGSESTDDIKDFSNCPVSQSFPNHPTSHSSANHEARSQTVGKALCVICTFRTVQLRASNFVIRASSFAELRGASRSFALRGAFRTTQLRRIQTRHYAELRMFTRIFIDFFFKIQSREFKLPRKPHHKVPNTLRARICHSW